jgi:hypothetical protein
MPSSQCSVLAQIYLADGVRWIAMAPREHAIGHAGTLASTAPATNPFSSSHGGI